MQRSGIGLSWYGGCPNGLVPLPQKMRMKPAIEAAHCEERTGFSIMKKEVKGLLLRRDSRECFIKERFLG